MCLVILITLYPVYYVVAASVSEADLLMRHGGLLLYPLGKLNVFSYELVFRNPMVLGGFANTFFVLIVGLCFNMVLTCIGAYLLALKGSMFTRPLALLILFTMYFSGGMIPAYMNVRDLGMIDSLWALIIPGAINTYNMMIMRSAFAAVPDTLYEAAHLDGATHIRILSQIYLPLSGATLAVMVLYYGVGHWNSWFNASIYISDTTKYPLQTGAAPDTDAQSEFTASGLGHGQRRAGKIRRSGQVRADSGFLRAHTAALSLPAKVLHKGRNGRRAKGLKTCAMQKRFPDRVRESFFLRIIDRLPSARPYP